MMQNYLNRPRREAFIGSIISGVIGLGSSIFGAAKQKEAQEEQYRLQQNTQYRNTGLTSAANLTQSFSNAYELDREFKDRFKKMGGRKKCEDGGKSTSSGWKWSDSDTSALISGLSSAGSNIATSLIGQANQRAFYPNAIKTQGRQLNSDENNVYDSAARSNMLNNYYRTAMLRCGGHRRM